MLFEEAIILSKSICLEATKLEDVSKSCLWVWVEVKRIHNNNETCGCFQGLFVDVGNNYSVLDNPNICFVYEYVGSKDSDREQSQYVSQAACHAPLSPPDIVLPLLSKRYVFIVQWFVLVHLVNTTFFPMS